MKTSNSSKCGRCGEWVLTARLADHRIWAHNVGGATGIKYWADDTERRFNAYRAQLYNGGPSDR